MILNYNPEEVERAVLKFWEDNQIYKKVKAKNKGKKPYYFLDGPPYTSGRIHLGIAWNKALKDCILRYKRMCNFDVWDRPGYDMHGLPTAHKVEEKLGIKTKEDIPKFGVDKFIEECKKLSLENMERMNNDFIRLGIWMDFKNAYQSITQTFIEGEWWLIKKAYENKRLYEGERVMHWCPNCRTVLAKHELEYKTIKDDSVFVKFPVKEKEKEFLIIWTTTPWTIPYNLAVMVNPELDYIKAKVDDEIWIVAKGLAGALINGIANKRFELLEEFKGEKLDNLRYIHPLYDEIPIYKEFEKYHRVHTVVLTTEYVNLSAGSGLVHSAPGCGPEDYEVGHRYGIPPFNNLEEDGTFPKEMGKFAGLIARVHDYKVIEELKRKRVLIATTPVEHEYPHCWRCRKPVIFRTTKQWFFKIEDLKEVMRKLNKKIFWQPSWAGYKWFDSWLENLRDNSITRQRYWGTPLPIWKCENCNDYIVIGSVNELKELAGYVPQDLHRPWIDEVTIKCSCGGIKKRIPDILDVWIDAGTTSWTCLDYPKNQKLFKKLWPPDFILEGKDQIRGWFNLLFVASMVSMKKPSYKAVYMHGFVQDALGRKMSKSLGNIISPYEVINKYGADTLRYYMIGGADPGLDINYNFDDVKVKYKNLVVLWNIHKLLIEYSKLIDINPNNIDSLLEEMFSSEEYYILSKLHSTIKGVTSLFEEYKINQVPWKVEELFLELSRTYIQLVREKLSVGKEEDKKIVLYVINKVLIEVLKLFAPIAPFITEMIYQNLKQEFGLELDSIHLYEWPKYDEKYINIKLERNIKLVSNIIQAALSGRDKIKRGVRWPLKELIITTTDKHVIEAVERLGEIIKRQVNVKELRIQESLPDIKLDIKLDYRQIAADFKEKTPKIIAKFSAKSSATIARHLKDEDRFIMKIDNEKITLTKEHLIIKRVVPPNYQEVEFSNGFLYLNKTLTEELESEGYAREIIRRTQNLRKKAGLNKKDRIVLFIKTSEDLKELLKEWVEKIRVRVGATKIKVSELNPSRRHKYYSKEKIKTEEIEIFFDKI